MIDLGHWDFADSLTALEASHLIIGIDPFDLRDAEKKTALQSERKKIQPVLEKMERAYSLALGMCLNRNDDWPPFSDEWPPFSGFGDNDLVSIELRNMYWRSLHQEQEVPLDEWLRSDSAEFENQIFSPDTINRWLSAKNLPSKYAFRKNAVRAIEARPASIDVGTKERNTLLVIVAAVCAEAGLDFKTTSKTAGLIRDIAHEKLGVSIGESTIEGHLKKIPSALESRAK